MNNGSSFVPPAPGIQGDYRGSCVVCMRGTDTALAVRGEAEALLAVLSVVGLGDEDAQQAAQSFWTERYGSGPGECPDGVHDWPVQVCEACCAESGTGMKPGVLPNVPLYTIGGGL